MLDLLFLVSLIAGDPTLCSAQAKDKAPDDLALKILVLELEEQEVRLVLANVQLKLALANYEKAKRQHTDLFQGPNLKPGVNYEDEGAANLRKLKWNSEVLNKRSEIITVGHDITIAKTRIKIHSGK